MPKRPGAPARGSATGRPVMVLLDVLGQRWTLRILWELRSGALTFRALRDACDGVSPSVLNDRLRLLRDLQLVEKTGDGYAPSARGEELAELLLPLDAWARSWARDLPDAPSG